MIRAAAICRMTFRRTECARRSPVSLRRTLFGWGSSSAESDDTSTTAQEYSETLWTYLRKLKVDGNLGQDDLLLEALKSDTLKGADRVLLERIQQIGSVQSSSSTLSDAEELETKSSSSSAASTKTPSPREEKSAASPSGQPDLTVEQAVQMEREVVERLKTAQPRFALMSIKSNPALSLAVRWQQMAGVMFGVLAQAIPTLGFTADQQGLMTYNGYVGALADAPENRELREAVAAKWDFATELAFGVTERRPMTQEVARQFTKDMTDRVTSPAFMNRIDGVLAKFGDLSKVAPDDTETHMKVQTELFPLVFEVQLEVSKNHGYEGDEGYVMAQRALMDHLTDAKVSEHTARMWQTLLQRFSGP